ncbi:MAG: nucleoside-diphosphate kinase, partial [Candidatus Delongbacteria bacterium]|nr:nucleoside-diphosphate kinase [Candidatus Delongbacteria bacterium]
MKEKTLCIIKPLAVQNGHIAYIIKDIDNASFRICTLKMLHMTTDDARNFYKVHEGKGFYDSLVEFMASGPVVVMALEKANAVADFRKLIGNTDPQKAGEGTIRAKYAKDISHNA